MNKKIAHIVLLRIVKLLWIRYSKFLGWLIKYCKMSSELYLKITVDTRKWENKSIVELKVGIILNKKKNEL